MMTGCQFVLKITGHLIFRADYGPLWGLVALFTILGLVFIIKALECMGVSAWKAILPAKKKKITKRHLNKGFRKALTDKPVSGGNPSAIWTGVQPEGAAGIADAGEVLFPGQASLAEALTRAYSEETGDEGLFSLCCEEELEDILAEAAEHLGQGPRRQEIPLAFLPIVTDGQFSTSGKSPESEKDLSSRLSEGASPEVQGEEVKASHGEAAGRKTFPDFEFLPLIDEGDENEAQETLFKAGNPITGQEAPDYSAVETDGSDEGVSIFEDLLNKCDIDAKLILLSELPAVGGMKELTLLKTLTLNENRRISKLARKLYRELESQLESVADSMITEPRPGVLNLKENIAGTEAVDEGKRPLEYCFLRETSNNYEGSAS